METLYEVWLHTICDFEPEMAAKVLPIFERNSNCFSDSISEQRLIEDLGISGEFSKRISEPKFFAEAKGIIKYCEDNGIRIITQESKEYPDDLKMINLPPRLLFAKGATLYNDELGVSVVGCRKPTENGKTMARYIGRVLAKNNITVVSGMAEGIDAQVHYGAIEGGGKTVAILAGSVDEVYPRCNEKLYSEILKNGGTILSERPPKTPVRKYFYQQRNRIIIGLSKGVVIVEGKEASGTSITARLALEENRDIFGVPGNPVIWQSELPNRVISEGGIIVKTPETPVEYYRDSYANKIVERPLKQDVKASVVRTISDDERILEYLRNNSGVASIETIADTLGIGINVLSGRLTILCIKGKLRQESGNRYVLTE